MFTPEFIDEEQGKYILVSNHYLENNEAVELSIAFNKSRILFANKHLPSFLSNCEVVYDIRGQEIPYNTIKKIEDAFRNEEVRFLRK